MKIANIGGAKAAIVEFRKKEYYFLFNGMALFALEDAFGNSEYFDRITQKTAEGNADLISMSAILAMQGELARRELGLSPKEDITEKEFGTPLTLQPMDILALRNGCVEAVNLGYTREVKDEDEEVDLGLIELQKKRK